MRHLRRFVPFLMLALVASARAERPADALLRLVPADAGATLAVEDLRGHARTFLGSPLFEGLKALPAVKAWYATSGGAQFEKARRDIEGGLSIPLTSIRDDLLGDAVVLAILAVPGERPDQSKGLLLTRFRDRSLLDRLIASVNRAEKDGGGLLSVADRKVGPTRYFVRSFRAGTKPTEAYAILDGNVFAWSNSERHVRELIERKASGGPGLAGDPRFRKAREGLPSEALASLFLDPAFLKRMAEADPKPKPDDVAATLLKRYLRAIDYVGAALQWRDGLTLHIHEVIDPTRLGEPWKSWAARPVGDGPLGRRLPLTAFAFVGGPVDAPALLDALLDLVPDAEKVKRDNLLLAARGLLLDRDPRAEIVRYLGPGVLFYVERPTGEKSGPLFPSVVVVPIGGDPGVSAALDNGLRTLLALAALDPKRGAPPCRVETRQIDGIRVTCLGGPKPIAYALEDGLLALGNAPEAVAGYFSGPKDSGPRFEGLRSSHAPRASAFAYADLPEFHRWASAHREELSHRLADGRGGEAARDLDQLLDFLGLFRAGFAASEVASDFTSAHRTLGLIPRDSAGK